MKWFLPGATALSLFAAASQGEEINPYPHPIAKTETIRSWSFSRSAAGWSAAWDCTIDASGDSLKIAATGTDAQIITPLEAPPGIYSARITARCQASGPGQIYWLTKGTQWGEDKVRRFPLSHDGEWHTYDAVFKVDGSLTHLRFDPGTGPGTVELKEIALDRIQYHPLQIVGVSAGADGQSVALWVKNDTTAPVSFSVSDKTFQAKGGETVRADFPSGGTKPFEAVRLAVRSEGLPDLVRTIFVHRPDAKAEWQTLQSGELLLRVAPDGSGAVIEREGRPVALFAPIVHFGGAVPKLELEKRDGALLLRGEGTEAKLLLAGAELSVNIRSDRECEGPVVRVLGPLEQGLLAGLEYLGKGERSSSTVDVETEDHLRFEPDPLKLTMPLMAFVTDRASVALSWEDTALQPVFASPNFFDGAPDHRMSLKGRRIEAVIRVAADRLEEAVLWAAKQRGLPPLPPAPRSREEQMKLSLAALEGPLKTEKGWGHCVGWDQRFFADMASTIWRITGRVPEVPNLVPGGAHIDNPAAYFLTGRTGEWLGHIDRQAADLARRQRADGSWLYDGKYRRGHFEDTASGLCANFAVTLLEHARHTGSRESLDAAVRALEYMKRFRTPRGAQTWEIPLHTPDILGSAWLVWAYTRGYELTGKKEYLDLARRWALTGVPFVYQWGRHPVMPYATVCVYGATDWRAPVWIGRPVQWCGVVYAYALTLLARHDDSLEWPKLAEGILIAAEQMQAKDGPNVGCMADNIVLSTQELFYPWINPCTLVALRLRLEGKLDSLAVARDAKHRVVAPFPVAIRDGRALIRAKRGVKYQVLVDGRKIIDVDSVGDDTVPLEE